MSKTFRNHIIFAVLAAIVLVVFVALFMTSVLNIPAENWVIDLYFKSIVKLYVLTFLPLLFAAESVVYAMKFIIEICLCYKKTKVVKWINVANIMAGALIFASYALTFNTDPENPLLSFPAYTWISYICSAVIVGAGIASIVVLARSAKNAKKQNA